MGAGFEVMGKGVLSVVQIMPPTIENRVKVFIGPDVEVPTDSHIMVDRIDVVSNGGLQPIESYIESAGMYVIASSLVT